MKKNENKEIIDLNTVYPPVVLESLDLVMI